MAGSAHLGPGPAARCSCSPVYARHSLRTPHPLVDLRLAVRRGVVGANAAALIAGAGMYMVLALLMVVSQAPRDGGYGLGLSVTTAGLLLVPYSVCSVLGNTAVRASSTSSGPTTCCRWAARSTWSPRLGLAVWHTEAWHLLVTMAVAGFGSGCTFAAMPALMVRFVPLAETGTAMAFNQVLRYLGFSAGSALSIVALEVFGGAADPGSFTSAVLASSGIWVVAVLVTLLLARAAKPRQPRRQPA